MAISSFLLKPGRSLVAVALSAAAISLSACGTAAGPQPGPQPQPPTPPTQPPVVQTTTIATFGIAERTGRIWSDARASRNFDPAVGDASGGLTLRSVYTFDLSQVPAGARIVRAELQLHESQELGDPYGLLGQLEAEHIDWNGTIDDTQLYDLVVNAGNQLYAGYGTGLPPAVASRQGNLRQFTVTDMVDRSLNVLAVDRVSMRIGFELPIAANGVTDAILLSPVGGADPNLEPTLIVTYEQ